MDVFGMIAVIVTVSVVSKMVIRIREMRMKERGHIRQEELNELISLRQKVERLESKMTDMEEQNYDLQRQTDKLEEHYDFINRLLEEHK